ncbi:MAG: hypothetical protein KGZ83_17620 [Sulfuricella sp.]|nr:hypothetical protein [Sulfuricella sp.]
MADEIDEPRQPDVTQHPDASDNSNKQAETFKGSNKASDSVEGVRYGTYK